MTSQSETPPHEPSFRPSMGLSATFSRQSVNFASTSIPKTAAVSRHEQTVTASPVS